MFIMWTDTQSEDEIEPEEEDDSTDEDDDWKKNSQKNLYFLYLFSHK